jgi:CrcB protein
MCGALTTFSTMQLELLGMLDGDRIGLAVAYAAVSAGAGFVAIAVATNLVRRARVTP